MRGLSARPVLQGRPETDLDPDSTETPGGSSGCKEGAELADDGPDGKARCGKRSPFSETWGGSSWGLQGVLCVYLKEVMKHKAGQVQASCILRESVDSGACKVTGKHVSSIEHIAPRDVKQLNRPVCSRAEQSKHLGAQPCLLDLAHVDPVDEANSDRPETKPGLGDAALLPGGPRCLAWAGPGFREEVVYCP